VALKTLEGALKTIVDNLLGAFDATEATREASAVLWPALLPLYAQLDPENTGGAMLLGVDGVCIISHGSSSAVAIVNAIRVARDMVAADVVGNLRSAISAAQG
jgi:glycerol-3-phosphate acyltransferase PlsX